MNPMYFDLPEASDTVSHEIRSTKSTETYVATRTTQELSRLERKTLDRSTSMMKKEPQGTVFKSNLEITHTVIIKCAHNINLGGVKGQMRASQLNLLN